jgi:hypothetical protein
MTRLKIIFICLLVCSLHVQGQSVYKNKNYGFSVTQPKGWSRQEAFDKNGVVFDSPGASSISAEIRVGARVIQPFEDAPSSSQTLDKIMNSFSETLEEYGKATKLSILRKERIFFAGMDGGLIAARYTDSKTGNERYVIEADAIHPSGAVYSVALECDPKESAHFTSIFEEVLRSLTVRKNPRGKLIR